MPFSTSLPSSGGIIICRQDCSWAVCRISGTFVDIRQAFTQPTVGLLQVSGITDFQHLICSGKVLGCSMCIFRQGCSLSMLNRTCEKKHGVLGWFNSVGVLGWVDWACPIPCTFPFILSPGVLRRTLSNIWWKLNLPIFLFDVGLLTLM